MPRKKIVYHMEMNLTCSVFIIANIGQNSYSDISLLKLMNSLLSAQIKYGQFLYIILFF